MNNSVSNAFKPCCISVGERIAFGLNSWLRSSCPASCINSISRLWMPSTSFICFCTVCPRYDAWILTTRGFNASWRHSSTFLLNSALKNTFVLPIAHWSSAGFSVSMIACDTFLASASGVRYQSFRQPASSRTTLRCSGDNIGRKREAKSRYNWRVAKPDFRILTVSITPQSRSWSATINESNLFGTLSLFGLMQRTKLQFDVFNLSMSCCKERLNIKPTVGFFFPAPPVLTSSSLPISCKTSCSDVRMSSRTSGGMLETFFSKNPSVVYHTSPA
mmetsp:Transcript_55149/g.159660  ORF Transcript_55149/g.159660 Transcript_55149/m.159660 type:complete len:275 (-) Transcript_55149:394-1218(-)